MRSTPRLLLALAAGGMLISTPALPKVYAQTDPSPSQPPQGSPTTPAPGVSASPANVTTTPAKSEASAPAKPVDNAPAAATKPSPTAPQSTSPATAPAVPTEKPAALKPAAVQDGLPQETDEERQFVELVNQERAHRGLGKLTIDPLLIAVAREHSAEMRDKNYFNHVSPSQGIHTPMDRYLKAIHIRPAYACVGENLYWCSVTDVQRGHNAFMNSPTHRENLLFPRYEKIGVGIVKDARGEFWVTEMFLTNSDPQLVAKKVARSH